MGGPLTSADPADREGMFIGPWLVDGLGSVVTCTWCGCVVVDIEAHQLMHFPPTDG